MTKRLAVQTTFLLLSAPTFLVPGGASWEGYFGSVTRELYLVQVTWFRNPMSPLNSRNCLNINCCSSEGLGPPDLVSHLTGRSPTKFHSTARSYYFWVSNKRICTPVEKQAKNTGHVQGLEYLTWVEINPLRNVHRTHFILIHCSLGDQELKETFCFSGKHARFASATVQTACADGSGEQTHAFPSWKVSCPYPSSEQMGRGTGRIHETDAIKRNKTLPTALKTTLHIANTHENISHDRKPRLSLPLLPLRWQTKTQHGVHVMLLGFQRKLKVPPALSTGSEGGK